MEGIRAPGRYYEVKRSNYANSLARGDVFSNELLHWLDYVGNERRPWSDVMSRHAFPASATGVQSKEEWDAAHLGFLDACIAEGKREVRRYESKEKKIRRELIGPSTQKIKIAALGPKPELPTDSGCNCEDNSEPIPCDGEVHTRTWGPVIPQWPSADQFGGAKRVRKAIQELRTVGGERFDGSDSTFVDYIRYRASLRIPSYERQTEKLRRRGIPHRGMRMEGGTGAVSAQITRGEVKYWPVQNVYLDERVRQSMSGEEISSRAARRGDTMRTNVKLDPRNLEPKIKRWVKDLTCALNHSGFTCQAMPHILPQNAPNQPSGSGRAANDERQEFSKGFPGKFASEGGDDNWFVSRYHSLPADEQAFSQRAVAGCVEVKAICYPATVFVPNPDAGGPDAGGDWTNKEISSEDEAAARARGVPEDVLEVNR